MNKLSKGINIIGIHGVPRSGTSWLAQIYNSHPNVNFKFQPLFSYAFKDYLDDKSSREKIQQFFEEIAISDDYFLNLKDPVIHQNYPVFKKNESYTALVFKQIRYHHLIENMLEKNDKLKFIFIIRNPLAVLNSWINTEMEFKPEWNLIDEWQAAEKKNQKRPEEFYGYNRWKEAANIFIDLHKAYPNRTLVINYNDLLLNTQETIRKLFAFTELNYHYQTKNFIEESKKRNDIDPNSVYKQKLNDDAWKQNIPKLIIDAVGKDLKNDRLADFLEV